MNPELTAALRSLAEVQLQIQASRSATLDARAIGVLGVDAAVATLIVGTGLTGQPSVAAFVLLGLSACLAGGSVFLGGLEEIGPSITRLIASDEIQDHYVLERALLDRLAADIDANREALAHKAPRLTGAFILLAFAILIALLGRVH